MRCEPEWEQWQAREFLHVEPVVIREAGHTSIVLDHVDEVVDAATRGLAPAQSPVAAGARGGRSLPSPRPELRDPARRSTNEMDGLGSPAS